MTMPRELSLSPLSKYEREEHNALVARKELAREYRTLQAKNQIFESEIQSLEEAYSTLVAENEELQLTCANLVSADEANRTRIYDLERELEEINADHRQTLDELEGLKGLKNAKNAMATASEIHRPHSSFASRPQVAHLQTQYEVLLEAYNKLEQIRKDDAKRWVGMKNGLDAEIHKLKAALRREKEKRAATKIGQADRKGGDENSQDKMRSGKAGPSSKKESGTSSDRAPLRSIFPPGSQDVEDTVSIKREMDLEGLAEIHTDRLREDSTRKADLQYNRSRMIPDQARDAVLPDVFAETRQAASPSAHRGRPIPIEGKDDGKTSSSGTEERERTMAEQVLDIPAGNSERIENHHEDVAGTTTEEDEGPTEANLRRRSDQSLLRRVETGATVQPAARRRARGTIVVDTPQSRTTGSLTPVIGRASSRSVQATVSVPRQAIETPVSGPSRQVASADRTKSRVTRTPSGMQWLGGEKTKMTRRDSFEDEVGANARIKIQSETVHTLPRMASVRPSAAVSAASTSKLPGSMSRLIDQAKQEHHTPTRAANASLKRKQMLQPDIPAASLVDTPARLEKRQKLTVTSSRRLEENADREEIYVVNPERNQGKTYTYHSVQRSKEQRRCMHGEACDECENWYEATRDIQVDNGIRFGRQSSTPDQLIDDDHEELALAQKQKLMNTVSRHKVEHEKNPTPPGYWEPGMPSTQAVERQNAEADEMVRAKRAKRQQEAEKPDGKWMLYNGEDSSLRKSRR